MNDALTQLFDGHSIMGLCALASVHWHLMLQTKKINDRVSTLEARLEAHLAEAHA